MRSGQLRKGNGRWRQATLQDFGIPKEDVATGPMTCEDCGVQFNPVLKRPYCWECGDKRKQKEKP